ncbi:hypothetical protein B9T07_26495 [Limnospira fusiformis CCALA 023]|uniref:DUF2752 domain-containing protein n=1 Tax=Limnospira platensis TaxID=118562 RepID=UPI00396E4268
MRFQLSSQKLSTQALQRRYFSLSCVSSPLVGAYLLGHTSASFGWKCLILSATGIPCPTCGMTRAFVEIARGNLRESLSYHGLGICVFVGFLLMTIHLCIEILTRRYLSSSLHDWLFNHKMGLVGWFLIVLLGYHGIRLAVFFTTGELTLNLAFI